MLDLFKSTSAGILSFLFLFVILYLQLGRGAVWKELCSGRGATHLSPHRAGKYSHFLIVAVQNDRGLSSMPVALKGWHGSIKSKPLSL